MIRFPFQRNKEKPVVEPNTEPSYTDSLYDRGLRLMRDNRLRRLLDARHRVYTEELDLLGIRFTGRWFILVLVKETRSLQNAEGQKDDLYRNICRTMDETLQDRAMRSWTVLDSGDVYSIVNFDSEHPELQRIKIIDVVEMALSMLRDTEDAQLRGYVSELGECPEDIPKLHQSLAFLSDYERLIQEDGLVLTYDRLSAARHQNLHQDGLRSMEETQRFFTAITQENYREAKAAMNELISSLLREVDITVMPLGLVKARLGYLINLLERKGALTLKEINDYYQYSSLFEGDEIQARTFTRYKDYIAETFPCYIEYNPRTGKYELHRHKALYGEALSHPSIAGLVIGTRPDCVDEEKLDYLAGLAHGGNNPSGPVIVVEYGIESCYDETLRRINRGHDFETARRAVEMTASRGIDVGAHFILGLPGETREMLLDQCETISSLPLTSVKFHQLQIVKGTRMEKEYATRPEEFLRLGLDEYLDLVIDILERLRPDLCIERVAGEVPPRFVRETPWGLIRNDGILKLLDKRLEERNTWQGRLSGR